MAAGAQPKPAAAPETGVVSALTLDGLGVMVPGGKRVLVPGALPGEQVTYLRRRRHRNYDEGQLIEVLESSPDRVAPRCGYFGVCGGCSLQHQGTAGQLAMKESALLDSLTRIGHVAPAEVLAPLTGATWGYRRRARLAARYVGNKDRVLVGFRERDQPYVTDMASCETVHPAISALLPHLSRLAGALSVRMRLPQVEATVADNATALVIRHLNPLTVTDRDLLAAFEREHGVRLYLQPGDPGSVELLDPSVPVPDLCYGLPEFGLTIAFGPTDFIQVHAEVNQLMISQALRLLAPAGDDRVLDLYCGIGNFTLPLAVRSGQVTGIEGAQPAVTRARDNALRAGTGNTRFVVADLAGAGIEGAWTREKFDLVLLDPPRNGAAELMPVLPRLGARRILYVSCHPGTLARDAGLLVQAGFRLVAAGIMDMFPQTSHVESMALFARD